MKENQEIEKKVEIERLLAILSSAPDSQIDKIITKRLNGLIGLPMSEIKTGVMHAIDDCVNGSLSSGFVLTALNILHENYLDGKPEDFNEVNCPWRKQV